MRPITKMRGRTGRRTCLILCVCGVLGGNLPASGVKWLPLTGKRAEKKPDRIPLAYLTPESITMIQEVKKQPDFRAEVIGRNHQTVVLVGETHQMTENSHRVGKALLEEFPIRGIEHTNHKDYWTHPILQSQLKTDAANLDSKFKFGSLTRYSRDEAFASKFFEELGKLAQLPSSDVTPAEREQLRQTIDEWELEVGDFSFSGKDFLSDPKHHRAITNVFLEEGHKPSLGNQISTFFYPWPIQAFVPFVASLPLIFQTWLPDALRVGIPLVALGYLASVDQRIQAGSRHNRHWWSYLLHPGVSILRTRDRVMAKNIVKALDEHPEWKQMLVVVGASHVPGMLQLLADQGFAESHPVPTPKRP